MKKLFKSRSAALIALSAAAVALVGTNSARALTWDASASLLGSALSGVSTMTFTTDGVFPVVGQTYTITAMGGVLDLAGFTFPIAGPTGLLAEEQFVYQGPGSPIFQANGGGALTGLFFLTGDPYLIALTSAIDPSTGFTAPGDLDTWFLFDGSLNVIADGVIANSSIAPTSSPALLTPIPSPAPLPLLGAAAAFSSSRRLRRRCRLPHGAPANLAK